MFSFLDKNKTFKPQKKYKENTKRHDLHKKAVTTVGRGLDLEKAVALPEGEGKTEWLAIHAIDFYNKTNLIIGAIKDILKKNKGKKMSAGAYEYRWRDDDQYKKPKHLSAIKHIKLTMEYIEDLVNDDEVFPEDDETDFPKGFRKIIKEVFKRLFRIYAHIMYECYDDIQKMGIEAHVTTTLKHFVIFCMEFKLLKKQEYEPLNTWIIRHCGEKYKSKLSTKNMDENWIPKEDQ